MRRIPRIIAWVHEREAVSRLTTTHDGHRQAKSHASISRESHEFSLNSRLNISRILIWIHFQQFPSSIATTENRFHR